MITPKNIEKEKKEESLSDELGKLGLSSSNNFAPNFLGSPKLNLFRFNGTHNDDLEIWLRQFETAFDTTSKNPQMQSSLVKIGQNYLDGNARDWLLTSDTHFATWQQFTEALKRTFHHCQGTTRYLNILRDRKQASHEKLYDYFIYMSNIARRAKCDDR